jgi:NADP-dependent 3-hydroxy acid dehydrogenase YdfG
MSGNIAGKVIVITGASSGLGEAAARHLSAAGAPVVLGARRTDRLDAIAKELTERGGEVLTTSTKKSRFPLTRSRALWPSRSASRKTWT